MIGAGGGVEVVLLQHFTPGRLPGQPLTHAAASNATVKRPKPGNQVPSIDPNLVAQTSFSAEGLIKDDLTAAMAVFIDNLFFNGPGGNSVTGLLQNSAISTVALGANGAQPTYQNMIAMETAVASHNADRGKMAYVTTSNMRGWLKNQPKNGTGYPQFTWENPVKADADGYINGYDAYVTNLIPSNLTKGTGSNLSAAVFGNYDDAILALWEGWDLLVDPYSNRLQGVVNISLMLGLDVQLRHAESFSKIVDGQTS